MIQLKKTDRPDLGLLLLKEKKIQQAENKNDIETINILIWYNNHMENFEAYRSTVKKNYDQIKEIDSDTAKQYLEEEKAKPEYDDARNEKIQNFKEQEKKPVETRENIEDLKIELSRAISKYYKNGDLNTLQIFRRKHGPQAPIELGEHSRNDLKHIISGRMSMVLREIDVEKNIHVLQLFKDTGALLEEDVEKGIGAAFETLKLRDVHHGEDNLNAEIIEDKVKNLRKKMEEMFA